MTTAATPEQIAGATEDSSNGGLFTGNTINGISNLIAEDVLAAQTAATNAATSETNAATSETNAATQATNASNSATSASTSASTATTGANTATSQASTATTQAGIATTKATAANTSAVNAASSESAAAGSATSASTSASTATSQANTATTQATNASNSATAAAASYDSFDDRYLGSKSSAPTTDNDGGTLLTGALYFNSSNSIMYNWTGSAWQSIRPTSTEQTNINILSAAAVITDMSILATAEIVADMAILGTNAVVADMAILATNDVVTDMNTLGTADVVADMNTLGTADVVADMNTLGTADVVSDMNTLASESNVTNMNTLAGISGNITTVAGISSDVTTVAGINAAVTAVNNNASNINTVSGISGNVTTVAGISSNVTSVAGSITNVNTVATNIGSVNNFSEVYRISSTAPTTSLTAGDLYFNTSTNVLNVYGDSGWQNAGSSVNGTSDRFHYDVSGTVTAVTGADAAGNILAYDAGYVDVYVNGVRMSTADVITTSGDTITFADALVSGDEVDIVAYGTFSITDMNASNLTSGTVPIARLGSGTKNTTTFLRGDNTFATVSQESTVINNNADNRMITGSATANTLNGEANLTFDGTTLGLTGNQTVSGTLGVTGVLTGTSLDISGDIDVDGTTNLDVVDIDGAVNMATTALVTGVLTANGGAVFNEGSADVDFRVESNGNANMLFVDGGNDRIGVGGTPTAYPLEIYGANGDGLVFKETTNSVTNWFGGFNSAGIVGTLTNHPLTLVTNATERMRITSAGNVGIGTSLPEEKVTINGSFRAASQDWQMQILNPDTAAANKGGGIAFGGSYTGTTQTYFSNILGAKENGTADNLAGYLSFYTRASGAGYTAERMRITSSGNVGIGVVPNSSWHSTLTALQIGGNASLSAQSAVGASKQAYFSQNVFNDGDQKYISTDQASNYYQGDGKHVFQVAASGSANAAISFTTAMTIDNSGNVGIGTSSPAGKLSISNGTIFVGSEANTTQTNNLLNGYGYRIGATLYGSVGIRSSYNSGNNQASLEFYTEATERMRITSSGNVGIGNTASGFNAQADNLIVGSGSGANGITIYSGNDSTGDIFFADGTSGDDPVRGGINYSHSNNSMNFRVNDAARMYITSSGKVGIGISSPNESLSVADSIVSGDLGDSTTTVYRLEPANTNFTRQLTISDRVGATAGAGKGNAIIFSSKYTGDVQQGMAGIVGISESISGNQNGALAFLTRAHDENPTERMRITSSGNVGIGTTSPANLLSLSASGSVTTRYTSGSAFSLLEVATSGTITFSADHGNGGGDTKIIFKTDGGTERMVIDNTARVAVNNSATFSGHGNYVGEVGVSGRALAFENTVGGGVVGTVTTGASSTAYNTSSDYRLKENVVTDWDATTRLKQLKPSRFNFIADADTTVDGFLAHEVQEIVPEAISGTKDAMTAEVLYVDGDEIPEGKVVGDVKTASAPDYQGIDQSKLVPLLVKTIQELEARITALENGE
jgi:hypothetical protein